jgi:hypothetical protein
MLVPRQIRPGLVALATTVALASTGCTATGGGSATPPRTPTAGSTGNDGGGSSGGGRSASPQPPPATPAGYPSDAPSYTQAALNAWATGDQARLDQLNDPADHVFQTISTGNYDRHFQLYQCQGAAGSSYCAVFNDAGDDLELHLSNPLLGQPHAIVGGDLHPITFPADLRAYAQEALDAWLAHNTARINLLTTPDAAAHLSAIPAAHQADGWTFADSEGAAGSSYLSWRNPAGDRISFRFYNPGVVPSESPQHRIRDVLFLPPS